MPEGSILVPTLLSIFINNLGKDIQAKLHLYADDAIIYMSAPSAKHLIEERQTVFMSFQRALKGLNLDLNTRKTKFVI